MPTENNAKATAALPQIQKQASSAAIALAQQYLQYIADKPYLGETTAQERLHLGVLMVQAVKPLLELARGVIQNNKPADEWDAIFLASIDFDEALFSQLDKLVGVVQSSLKNTGKIKISADELKSIEGFVLRRVEMVVQHFNELLVPYIEQMDSEQRSAYVAKIRELFFIVHSVWASYKTKNDVTARSLRTLIAKAS